MDQSVEQAIKQQVLAIFAELKNKTVNVEEILYQPIKQSRKNLGVFGDDLKLAKQLLAVLKLLVEESKIKPLPAAKSKKWNKTTGLPDTVVLIRNDIKPADPEVERIKNETAWEPTKMAAIAPNIKTLEDANTALVINDYLKYRPTNPAKLPARERALQLLGDEKALDDYRENKGLFNNQLQLADIDCFYCPEPLPFQPLALFDKRLTSNKPLLIVENANTYYSCCQANQQLQQFAAIVYGKGKQISSEAYCDSLAALEVQLAATAVYYFGDIDLEGFKIPKKITEIRETQGQSPLKPTQELYQALLAKNITTPMPATTETQQKKLKTSLQELQPWVCQWLGDTLAKHYFAGATEKRWPQEGLTAGEIITQLSQ